MCDFGAIESYYILWQIKQCSMSLRKTLHTHVEGWLSPCFWRAHLTGMMRHLLYEDALYLQISGESRIRFAGSSLTFHCHELVRLFFIGVWWHDRCTVTIRNPSAWGLWQPDLLVEESWKETTVIPLHDTAWYSKRIVWVDIYLWVASTMFF